MSTKLFPIPMADRVLVLQEEAKTKTEGGIDLPEMHVEKPLRGFVLAVGPGRWFDNGTRQPPSIERGDTVLFSKYAGNPVEFDGETYLVLTEEDVLCRIPHGERIEK